MNRVHRMTIRAALFATASAMIFVLVGQSIGDAGAQDEPAGPRRPDDFAIVFTLGYAGDLLPAEPEAYDEVMGTLVEGGFNTVLASHEPWRLPIMKEREMKLMVDLLDERHHVYHDPEASEALVSTLAGEESVWGYHLFSDTVGSIVAGRERDVRNVHTWDPDPAHSTFVGFKKADSVGSAVNDLLGPDVVGYYDYHWVRDRSLHFRDLKFYGEYARDHDDAPLYRWVWVQNGRAGIGNPNRSRYTVFTSLAFGMKGVVWFIGQQMINTSTWGWNQFGLDTISVNLDVAPLGPELMKLRWLETFSTETTRTMNNDEKGPDDPPIPPPLDAIPEDLWVQVESGEVVIGLFKDGGRDALIVANHNAYMPQDVTLRFVPDSSIEQFYYGAEIFDRVDGVWKDLPRESHQASFKLGPGYGELVRPIWSWALATPIPTAEPEPPLTPEPTPASPAAGKVFLPLAWPGR